MATSITSPAGDTVQILADEDYCKLAGLDLSALKHTPGRLATLVTLWSVRFTRNSEGKATNEVWQAARRYGYKGSQSAFTQMLRQAPMLLAVTRDVNGRRTYRIGLTILPRTWLDGILMAKPLPSPLAQPVVSEAADGGGTGSTPEVEPTTPVESPADQEQPSAPLDTPVSDERHAASEQLRELADEVAREEGDHSDDVDPGQAVETGETAASIEEITGEDEEDADRVEPLGPSIPDEVMAEVVAAVLGRFIDTVNSGDTPIAVDRRVTALERELEQARTRLSDALESSERYRLAARKLGDELASNNGAMAGLRQANAILQSNLDRVLSQKVRTFVQEQVAVELGRIMAEPPSSR